MTGPAAGGFTEEEACQHDEGFARIRAGLEEGLGFDEACGRLEIADEGLRRVVADDYLKVTIAERHFQGGAALTEVAAALKLPAERVAAARQEMVSEVARASVEVFRRQSGLTPEDA